MNTIIRHSLIASLLFSSCLLLGCGGCAATEKQTSLTDVAGANPTLEAIEAYEPLSASTIFTYLVFNRALQNNHEPTIISTLKDLLKDNPPASIFIDAGIWALENKSARLIPLMKESLDVHPQNISLHLLYAELLQKSGQVAKAIDHIEGFIEKNPTVVDAKLELALLLSHSQKFDEAVKILLEIDEKDRTGLVDYYHAKALLGLKKNEEALAYLEKSVEKMPEFMDSHNDLAFLYEQKKDFAKARDVYEKMLTDYADNHELMLRIIMLSLRLNEPEKALEYFENSPMTPELTISVASMFVDAGKYDVAEPILLGLADIPGAPQDLYFYLAAIAYERDKNPEKTYEWLTQIDADSKYYERALFLRMQLLLDLDKLDLALEEVRKGKKIVPENTQFSMAEIRILVSLKKFNEALSAADAMRKRWPQNMDIAYLHASVLDQSGAKEKAFDAMEKIITTEPDYFQALNYVGYTLAEQSKELSRAVRLLRKADRLSPNSNYILDSLAWALFKNGDVSEAWEYINKAVTAQGFIDPAIWEHYGDIARSLGKKEEARKGYKKALEHTPQNASAITYKLNQL